MSKFIDGLVSIDLSLAIRAVAIEIATSADNYAAEAGNNGERAIALAASVLADRGIEFEAIRNPGSDEVRLIADAAYAINEARESHDTRTAQYCLGFAWHRLVQFERDILTPEEIEGRIRVGLRKALRAA
jgi:hypothetical protein